MKAELFNDPESEYEVLVASDAIGMGLNLNIARVVFSTMYKFDGHQRRPLTDSEIKQIAGRAGRYRSIFPTGEVTAYVPSCPHPQLHWIAVLISVWVPLVDSIVPTCPAYAER
jgi:superfamily II RNA helicase